MSCVPLPSVLFFQVYISEMRICSRNAQIGKGVRRREGIHLRNARGIVCRIEGFCPRDVQIGKGVMRREGTDVALVGYGTMVTSCLAAAEALSKAGIEVGSDLRRRRELLKSFATPSKLHQGPGMHGSAHRIEELRDKCLQKVSHRTHGRLQAILLVERRR